MEQILLNTSAAELTFNIKDVIYIVTFVISILTAWYRMQMNHKDAVKNINNLNEKVKENADNLKVEQMATSNGRRAIKKELVEVINEKDKAIHRRINKTNDNFDKYIEKTESEFKEINKNVSDVKSDIGEMKGMLKTLLNK